MKLSNVLLAVDENQWISIIDEFGYRIFRGFRKSALESIPDLEVTEIASAGDVLIIEVRKCV